MCTSSTDARMEEVLATHAGMLDQVTAIALARFRPSVASAQEIQCCGADVHALPTPLLHTDVQRRAALELCRELYPSLAASSDMEVTADPRFHARVLEVGWAAFTMLRCAAAHRLYTATRTWCRGKLNLLPVHVFSARVCNRPAGTMLLNTSELLTVRDGASVRQQRWQRHKK